MGRKHMPQTELPSAWAQHVQNPFLAKSPQEAEIPQAAISPFLH